ncbi:MAG TPA: hypothetical protein VKZ72_00225, partial [Acidimicrobiales bacterium]|nr:hypothetical protein [Acidimicrobiales bacterium]
PRRDQQAAPPTDPGGWTPSPAPQQGAGWPDAGRAAPGPAPEPPAPASGGAPGAGTTPGGLTRRVRGANMPATQPLRMRRGGQQQGAPAAPAGGAGTPPPRTAEQRRKADDVYNFLSQFTAGVQRGIEESRG